MCMKWLVRLCVLLMLTGYDVMAQEANAEDLQWISDDELALAGLINAHRMKLGLDSVAVSVALTTVARVHVRDLYVNKPDNGRCNLHSWSKNGEWTACCYTDNHDKAPCMWNKPRELTSYGGDGYEIAFFSSYNYGQKNGFIDDALASWKNSPGHYAVIRNLGPWKNMQWKAMGVGIYKGYAAVWFGIEIDELVEPDTCRVK